MLTHPSLPGWTARAVWWWSSLACACKHSSNETDAFPPSVALPCPRSPADHECRAETEPVEGARFLAGYREPDDYPTCAAAESLQSACARFFGTEQGVCPTLDQTREIEQAGWNETIEVRWRGRRYMTFSLHHETVDRGDDLPAVYLCHAYFDMETRALVSVVDRRFGDYCCGEDGPAQEVIYGEAVLRACWE
jgi:hypothetical protein